MAPNLMTQRNATPGDKQFLGRLYRDTRRREVESWGWPQQQRDFFLNMQFEAQYRSYSSAYPDANDQIICVDEAPVGRMMVARDQASSPPGMHLIDIALLENFRNRGIGGQLIRELLEQCQREGLVLRLQVLRVNPAIRLYERLGFVQTTADAVYMQMEGNPPSITEKT